jgi:hypothetical protein
VAGDGKIPNVLRNNVFSSSSNIYYFLVYFLLNNNKYLGIKSIIGLCHYPVQGQRACRHMFVQTLAGTYCM